MAEAEQFRDSIVQSLASLDAGQRSIIERLDQMKTSIGNLWGEVRENERSLLVHARDCDLKDRIQKLDVQLARLEKQISDESEAAKVHQCHRKEWLEWVRPLIWATIAVIAALAIQHGNTVAPLIKP